MLIPCIDLQNGKTVQLEQGKKLKIESGDPFEFVKKFAVFPWISIIDIDSAKNRKENNKELIKEILLYIRKNNPGCKVIVGGGIRTAEIAQEFLNNGAAKVMVGTMAIRNPEILKQLPKDRVIIALDNIKNEIVTDGWQKKSGRSLTDTIKALRDYSTHFFVTFVENEGTMKGIDLERVKNIISILNDHKDKDHRKLSIAGGINSIQEIKQLDELDVDCHVGMAVYTGKIGIGESLYACLNIERKDGLIPTIVVDIISGQTLGLVYSSKDSLIQAVNERKGIYYSRKRKEIWRKGKTSGFTQELKRIDFDCDRDCLKFSILGKGRKHCHLKDRKSCFSNEVFSLQSLFEVINHRKLYSSTKSYTRELLSDDEFLRSKIIEEANELIQTQNKKEVVWESCDLMYFIIVYCVKHNVKLNHILAELERRNMAISKKKKEGSNKTEKIFFAIPKGRIKTNIIKLFERLGITFIFKSDRDYRPTVICNNKNEQIKKFIERCNFFVTDPRNTIEQLQSGMISLGFSGTDLFLDRTHIKEKVFPVLELGYNKVEVCIASLKGTSMDHWKAESKKRKIIVYTEYPKLTRDWIKKKKLNNWEVHFSNGATEGLVGLCDIIVCVKETGSTLERNNLITIDEPILYSQSVLFANQKLENFSKEALVFFEELKKHL